MKLVSNVLLCVIMKCTDVDSAAVVSEELLYTDRCFSALVVVLPCYGALEIVGVIIIIISSKRCSRYPEPWLLGRF